MKKNHPPVYYTIRTAVRTLVWGGLAMGSFLVAMEATDDDRPSCDITITSPATWEAKGAPVNVSECVAPANMVLSQDGTWEWVSE
jgi:hypothetical protein